MFKKNYTITTDLIQEHYNHVNHATTVSLLEKARIDFLIDIGFPLKSFLENNLFIVIYHLEVLYKRELFKENVTITCENCRVEGKQILLNQKIYNEKGKIAVEAEIELRMVSGKTKRSIEPDPTFAQAFQNLH